MTDEHLDGTVGWHIDGALGGHNDGWPKRVR